MFTILLLIFLGLIVALVVGLVRPFRYWPMSKTKPTRKMLGMTFGGLILACFILLGITAPQTKVADTSMQASPTPMPTKTVELNATPTNTPKKVIPTPTSKPVAKANPTPTPKPQYKVLYNDDNGSVVNIFVKIDPSSDNQNTVKAISQEVEKNVCKDKCNINIFDDVLALDNEYDYLQKSANFTPAQDSAWMKANYVDVADHYVGSHEFEIAGDFTYYPFKNSSDYQKYKNQ